MHWCVQAVWNALKEINVCRIWKSEYLEVLLPDFFALVNSFVWSVFYMYIYINNRDKPHYLITIFYYYYCNTANYDKLPLGTNRFYVVDNNASTFPVHWLSIQLNYTSRLIKMCCFPLHYIRRQIAQWCIPIWHLTYLPAPRHICREWHRKISVTSVPQTHK